MKTLSLKVLFFFLLLIPSCKNEAPVYSEKLETSLKGFNRLRLTDHEIHDVLKLIQQNDQLAFPVYSIDGALLTREQVLKKTMNVTLDCYGESPENLKAVVFRDQTKAEVEAFFKRFDEEARLHAKKRVNLVSKPAPLFTTKDIEGQEVDLAALKGKVVVLNFWFIGCYACVQEMPELNETVQAYQRKDVVFLGLTFDKAQNTKAFLQRTRFDYRIIAEAKPIIDLYGGGGFPRNIVIDKTGTVIASEVGYKPYRNVSRKNLMAAIEKALAGDEGS